MSTCNPYNGSQYDYSKSLEIYKPALQTGGDTLGDAVTNLKNMVHYSNAITGGDGRKPEGGKYFWGTGGKCDVVTYKAIKKSDAGKPNPPPDTECKKYAEQDDDANFNNKCKIISTNESVDRFGYIDNAIGGPSLTGGSIGGGLLSGALGNTMDINGSGLISSLMGNASPECQAVSLEIVDRDGCVGSHTANVTNNDISQINACNFTKGINPITGLTCMSGFNNINAENYNDTDNENYNENNDDNYGIIERDIVNMPNSITDKLFLSTITLLLFYILYKLGRCRK